MTTTDTNNKGFIKKYMWVMRAVLMAAALWLVSSYWYVGACSLLASVTKHIAQDKKIAKHFYLIPLFAPLVYAFVYHFVATENQADFLPARLLIAISVMLFFILDSKKTNGVEWIGDIAFPFALHFIIEFMQRNAEIAFRCFTYTQNILHYGHLYGLLVIVAVATFFHLFFSKRVSWYITTALFGLLGLTNFFVFTFTGQAFIPSDLMIARTAFGVMSTQILTPYDIFRLIMSLLFVAGLIVACTFVYKKEKRDTRKIGQRASVLCLLLVFVFASWMTCPWFKRNLPLYSAHSKYSFVTNFIVNLDYGIHFPDGVEEYVIEDKDLDGDFKPNVIIVMNEAFSDLNSVFNLNGEENLEYFDSLREKYPSGIAYSSVKGNNTCSSEWEALSGVSTALTVKGANIYQDNCKNMNTLVNVFNRRGYYTVGVHPYYRSGYNRDNLYSAIGFQEEVFEDSFREDADTIRNYITDEENYKKIIELYEQNSDKPFFCFNITMQNHGAYNVATKDITPYATTPHADVNQYLSLVNTSDKMLNTLIGYFEKVEEPTIILFFGDHQPAITNSFYENCLNTRMEDLTTEQLQLIYQVPYLIWANYELNDESAPKETSINYLSSVLFEVGNIPSTTWIEKLNEFREEWPVLTVNFAEDKDGNLYTTNEAKSNELIHEYLMRSFAILLGEETND